MVLSLPYIDNLSDLRFAFVLKEGLVKVAPSSLPTPTHFSHPRQRFCLSLHLASSTAPLSCHPRLVCRSHSLISATKASPAPSHPLPVVDTPLLPRTLTKPSSDPLYSCTLPSLTSRSLERSL